MSGEVIWKHEPEDHDFPAAAQYLSLVMPPETADQYAESLREAETVHYKAKDLLRASRLDLLPRTNAHVAKNLAKIHAGDKLSPVLLVRGDHTDVRDLVVADGYHRICASYWYDEDTLIPCRIV